MNEVPWTGAHFPDAVVRLAPVLHDVVRRPFHQGPEVFAERGLNLTEAAVLGVKVNTLKQLAAHVELLLPGGGVADAHRPGAAVAVQVGKLLLRTVPFATDAV